MQRSLGPFLFLTALIIGLGVGEIVWTRLHAPGCQDWQAELQRRVDAYARMHLPEPAPQVQVQAVCGQNGIPDALFFRWRMLTYKMGWRSQKPLEDTDLRMAATRDLMQHPDMGTLKFTIRFDPTLNMETRKRVEELISHYLMVDDQRQKLEFKRLKKGQENTAVKGSLQAPELPSIKAWRPPLMEASEPQLRSSLMRAGNAILILLWVSLGAFFLVGATRSLRRARPVKKAAEPAAPPRESGAFAILFAPRVFQDFGERGRELWRLLVQLDEKRAARRVQIWWEKDREGLVQFLGLMPAPAQEAMLAYLSTDRLLQLTDGLSQPNPRDAQRAVLRVLLDIARELAGLSGLMQAPLFIHLMTRREWQRVAQQMTRPRRRALSELLDKERAQWLRARQDLHPGWFQTGAKEDMNSEQLVRRVRSVLQVDADQLRELLYADREAMAVVDSYFADLTLDTALNSDLAMLVLGACQHRQVGLGRLIERRDPNLLLALEHLDDQQVALLLYENEAALKTQFCALLGTRGEAVGALIQSMEDDRQHNKSLRMQARGMQRFVERQVLIADLFCG